MISVIAPVATTIPPPKSGSVETMTSLLTEGLVASGVDVTLFATADSKTNATLHGTYPRGYWHETRMPDLRLSEKEAADITAYLMSLKNDAFVECADDAKPCR